MSADGGSGLKRLPPAYLESVCHFLDGYDLCHLWFCGDSVLNARLAVPGVVKAFRIVYRNFLHRKWPRFFSMFSGLEELDIKLDGRCMHVGLIDVDLTLIPKSIRKIVLDFPRSGVALFRSIPDPSTEVVEPRNMELNSLWPNLQELHMEQYRFLEQSETPDLIYHSLSPSTGPSSSLSHLTSLTLGTEAYLTPTAIGLLPKSLTFLNVRLSPHDDAWRALSDSLGNLNVSSMSLSIDSADKLAMESIAEPHTSDARPRPTFPPFLSTLVLKYPARSALCLLHLLPRTLTSVNLLTYFELPISALSHLQPFPLVSLECDVGSISESVILGFSPTMTNLVFRNGFFPYEILQHLPPSLVSFDCSSANIAFPTPPVAPTTMVTVDAENPLRAHARTMLQRMTAALPKTLTRLNLGVTPWRLSSFVPHLPRSLSRFTLEDIFYPSSLQYEHLEDDFFRSLPRGLEKLEIVRPHDALPATCTWASLMPNERLNSFKTSWTTMPSGSLREMTRRQRENSNFQTLILKNVAPQDIEELSALPTSLTHLRIDGLIDIAVIDWTWAKNLETLHCAIPSHTSSSSSRIDTTNIFASLPRSLTDLKILTERLDTKIFLKKHPLRFTASDASLLHHPT